jgi:hypothetical protein
MGGTTLNTKFGINTWGLCISEGCDHPTPPGHAFCRDHWELIPRAIRRLYLHHRPVSPDFVLELARRLSIWDESRELQVSVAPPTYEDVAHFPTIQLDPHTQSGAFYCYCGHPLGPLYRDPVTNMMALNLTPEIALAFCNHCINMVSPEDGKPVEYSHEHSGGPHDSGHSQEGGIQRPQLLGSEKQ